MIFVDESIHKDLDLICVSFVHSTEDPHPDIERALKHAGLEPGLDEYKSGVRMVGKPHLHGLRDAIGAIAMGCRFAVYVAPLSELARLQASVVDVGTSIVRANSLAKPQSLFLDEGMAGRYSCDPSELVVHAGCDSKHRLGIQLADYVAYHCALLLKTRLTGVVKNHKMDDTPHPLAGEEVPLDWLVRTEMRRQFFHEPRDFERIEGDDWFFKVSGYGFFSSPDLSTEVRDAAQATFDEMYLGCVW
ncbi:DUF3800 domain-containing protein [Stenotrophomonas maltophilia]|uniref:DUF3800 domain-containing protein n=1 Tax=Stenotrophomonas maltophilia TaxID=40324 RepID=UPI00107176D8|nr:DUF3800 domain-containing protein [Stenotrophomonas maltophilia]